MSSGPAAIAAPRRGRVDARRLAWPLVALALLLLFNLVFTPGFFRVVVQQDDVEEVTLRDCGQPLLVDPGGFGGAHGAAEMAHDQGVGLQGNGQRQIVVGVGA